MDGTMGGSLREKDPSSVWIWNWAELSFIIIFVGGMASVDVSVVADSTKEEENLDVDSSKDKNIPQQTLDLSTEKTNNVHEKVSPVKV